jgi:hypothetical protein
MSQECKNIALTDFGDEFHTNLLIRKAKVYIELFSATIYKRLICGTVNDGIFTAFGHIP